MIRVFVRNWYKRENGQLVPNFRARKTTLALVETEEQARAMAQEYNRTHKPGPLSRKAEWMKK